MHMQRAAETLKVSLGVMKVHMRTLGILKWSSRKRGAIRRLLRHSPDLQGRSGNTVSYLSWPKSLHCMQDGRHHLPNLQGWRKAKVPGLHCCSTCFADREDVIHRAWSRVTKGCQVQAFLCSYADQTCPCFHSLVLRMAALRHQPRNYTQDMAYIRTV